MKSGSYTVTRNDLHNLISMKLQIRVVPKNCESLKFIVKNLKKCTKNPMKQIQN